MKNEKILIVESGEYSYFTYVPMVVPETFDEGEAVRAFRDHVFRDGVPKEYEIEDDLVSFLSRTGRARDVTDGDVFVLRDPVHYNDWQPDESVRLLMGELPELRTIQTRRPHSSDWYVVDGDFVEVAGPYADHADATNRKHELLVERELGRKS